MTNSSSTSDNYEIVYNTQKTLSAMQTQVVKDVSEILDRNTTAKKYEQRPIILFFDNTLSESSQQIIREVSKHTERLQVDQIDVIDYDVIKQYKNLL